MHDSDDTTSEEIMSPVTEYTLASMDRDPAEELKIKKYTDMLNELPEEPSDPCMICFSQPRSAAFIWCKHLALCHVCMEALPIVGETLVADSDGKMEKRILKNCLVCRKDSIFINFFLN